MREMWFGARERRRMTVTQGFVILYVVSFFQAVIECLVYPHLIYIAIAFLGSLGVGASATHIASQGGEIPTRRVVVMLIVFLAFITPLRVAVYTFMGAQ